jgi:hypothetical protein
VVAGLLFAGFLIVLGLGTAIRQWRTVSRFYEERFLPEGDRVYLRGQVRRRLILGVVLVAVGGMIAGYYLSGMDAEMDRIGEKKKAERAAQAEGQPPAEDAKPEPTPEERQFAKMVGWYWIGVLLLVGVVGCLAVLDFWATRVYWMARYREMKAEHEAKLQRDLAVYRQQRLNDRMKGKRKPDDGGSSDDTGEHPPVE